MHKNGDFIVTHFDGNPDMWNTKPPLLVWCQVFFMKIFGVNELAVRLPSAIAAFLTCLALLLFTKRILNNSWIGFLAILVLITSKGYISLHGTRTGDYDALLTLFTTVSGLLFFGFCESRSKKLLYLFFAFTALAVLTKGIAGLMFAPALFVYSIIRREFIPLLRNKHFYLGSASFLVVVLGYYFLRELNNPGYLLAVQANELGGRYLEVLEEHQHGFWFYYDNLIEYRFSGWYLLIPCGIAIGFLQREKVINRITLFLILMILTYFLVISSGQTKLPWYDIPLYPYLSLLAAIFLYFIFSFLQNSNWANQSLRVNVTPYIFLFLVFMTPYHLIFKEVYKPRYGGDFYEITYFLRDAVRGKHEISHHKLLYKGYNAHNKFYVNLLNDQGADIAFQDWKKLENSDLVIANQSMVKKYIDDNYEYRHLTQSGNVNTYQIIGKVESK
jgi:4-amino-4-deoxy-L-arabinose transferase-like glycosyltransferase